MPNRERCYRVGRKRSVPIGGSPVSASSRNWQERGEIVGEMQTMACAFAPWRGTEAHRSPRRKIVRIQKAVYEEAKKFQRKRTAG